jgi:AraC-like DNA-binding protein
MALYVWEQRLDPEFPLAVLEYETGDDRDPMHWHDHLEIALVLEGSGAFRFGQRSLRAEPGDVFFIDNSQPHVALAAAGSSLRLLLILFRPELIARPGCSGFDLAYLAPFRVDERTASPRICGTSALAAEVAAVLHELRAMCGRGDAAERHLVDATLRRALALVNRHHGADPATPPSRTGADRRDQIRPVLAYVDRHCRESITLDEVAGVIHVSSSRVRHVFKDVTGVSFKDYLTQVRVAEAKRLLLAGDEPVAEVARRVSYTNLHQFYKVFHRSCAMSPAAYRRYYTPAARGGSPRPSQVERRAPRAGRA